MVSRPGKPLCIVFVVLLGAVTIVRAEERFRLLTSVDAASTVSSVLCRDRDLVSVRLDGVGPGVITALGAMLPTGVGVDAVSLIGGGRVVFSTNVSFNVARVEADDEDLVLYDHGALSLFLDGSAAGIPAAADIDAVHVIDGDPIKILYSVDSPTKITGLAVTDDDIISYTGGKHALVVAGSVMLGGEASRADVDGLWYDPRRGEYALSLDVPISGGPGRTAAAPDDVVLWANGALVMLFDASDQGVSVPGLDLDGVHIESAMFVDGFETGGTGMWSAINP